MTKINNIILDKNIKLKVTSENWINAMKSSGQLLVDSNFIKKEYIDATLETVKKYGPYIVIAPGIALSHSRPSENVIKTGVSLITLSKPICFNCENDPVDIVLTLAATNDNDHLGILQHLSCYLSDDDKLHYIRSCSKPKDLAKDINEYQIDL